MYLAPAEILNPTLNESDQGAILKYRDELETDAIAMLRGEMIPNGKVLKETNAPFNALLNQVRDNLSQFP
jgi:hypothetical protein